jgi:hypothetical protein
LIRFVVTVTGHDHHFTLEAINCAAPVATVSPRVVLTEAPVNPATVVAVPRVAVAVSAIPATVATIGKVPAIITPPIPRAAIVKIGVKPPTATFEPEGVGATSGFGLGVGAGGVTTSGEVVILGAAVGVGVAVG